MALPAESIPKDQRKHLLIHAYMAIRPIDSIDEACRDHDVCWLLHDDGSGECNREFRARLGYIQDYMGDVDPNPLYSREWRCTILAGDIGAAFLTLFVEDRFKTPGSSAGAAVAKLLTTPLQLLIPVLRLPLWVKDPYPFEGERCFVPSIHIDEMLPPRSG